MSEKTKEEIILKNSKVMMIPPATYEKIVKTSLKASQQDMLDLEKAVEGNNFDSIDFIMHRFKGTYSNLRLLEVSTLANEINDMSKNQTDIEIIKERCGELKNVIDSLRAKFS